MNNQIKIASLVAGAIVVVGVIGVLAFTPAGQLRTIGGTSADVGDIVAGNVIVVSQADYQLLLAELQSYAEADETTRSTIIQEAIRVLSGWSPQVQ
ncbi:MAG: hypothetical protein V1807_02940 [Patescibacteria group bacterium]